MWDRRISHTWSFGAERRQIWSMMEHRIEKGNGRWGEWVMDNGHIALRAVIDGHCGSVKYSV
jgi:hypothetical protein